MTFHILTIFPHIFDSYINETILKRAQNAGSINITIHDIRAFATDKHKTTDDTPTGGGPGMVMKIEPIYNCLLALRKKQSPDFDIEKNAIAHPSSVFYSNDSPILLMTPRGKQFTQTDAQNLTRTNTIKNLKTDNRQLITEKHSIILICGRYEGVDQRVADHMVDYEYSIGPYVLSGGELPALIITEAIARLIPGVLGNEESLQEESHSVNLATAESANGRRSAVEYPQYTKPATFSPIPDTEWRTPDILLSGNHAEIKKWKNDHATRS
ncbi:MAG TPA: tRNA (guanine(37)-N(1))-methyltransferase [Patescibacteria group bacterium]|nr:tRNA (guanine(37)-N(1))-methyltransferase [Patescibacteria group bacterium]